MATPIITLKIITLLLLLPILSACVSYSHKPDPAQLIDSPNCEIVNGRYLVSTAEDSDVLSRTIFASEERIDAIEIEATSSLVRIVGQTAAGSDLTRDFPRRFSCTDSVLKLVLDDQYSGDALIATASDRFLELFSIDERSLYFRFINTSLAFFFILPTYNSSDDVIIVQREGTLTD